MQHIVDARQKDVPMQTVIDHLLDDAWSCMEQIIYIISEDDDKIVDDKILEAVRDCCDVIEDLMLKLIVS